MPAERPDQAQGGEDGEAADRGGAPGERLLEEHREEFDELASRLLHRVGIAGDEVREVVGRRRMGEEEAAAAKKKKKEKSISASQSSRSSGSPSWCRTPW